MLGVRVHLPRPLAIQTSQTREVSELVPGAFGDLVKLLGDDVGHVGDAVGAKEVIHRLSCDERGFYEDGAESETAG